MIRTFLSVVIASFCFAILFVLPAHAGTFGVHTVSHHFPNADKYSNVNPGFYCIADNGLTVGVVRNSFKRTTVYGGRAFTSGRYSVLVGVATGYQIEHVAVACPRVGYEGCYREEGDSRGALKPLVIPSVRFGLAEGVAARISYSPKTSKTGAHMVHLSFEY